MQRQVILDTETTGLDPKHGHRVIEIGCVEVINRKVTNHHFHYYINPERDIHPDAVAIHGLTKEFLSDKPLFQDIIQPLIDYLKDAELIIHNAPFDVGFLNHEFKLVDTSHPPITDYCHVIDTLTLARRKHPGQRNSLDALCSRYHVDNTHRELHGALLDAQLLSQVYLLMTGGQTQLFQTDTPDTAPTEINQKIRRLPTDRTPLPIIEPTLEEKQAHEAFLEKLKESSKDTH